MEKVVNFISLKPQNKTGGNDMMKRQKKILNNGNGITLIALVISIILLLILAGVSISATVGDNGIITKAQDATILSSIASLQEFLQTKYVENFEDITSENGSNKTSLERLMELYPDWFYSEGSKDYILQEYTYTDNLGSSQVGFLKLRLIRKVNLPDEIKNQLNIGDAIGTDGEADSEDAYNRLKDVLGITNDLKIFYCSDGLETAIGADYLASDTYDGTKVLYTQSSPLAQAIASTTGDTVTDLSMQDLRTVKELTIDSSMNITDLSILSDLPNLTKLTLTNYNGSLKGIERAYKLTYLYFNNSAGTQNINYTGLSKVTTLSELYCFMPTNTEVEKMCTEMSNTDYNNLQTIGLYGYMHTYYITQATWRCTTTSNTHSQLNTLSSLAKLTATTKSKVVTMYLQNNSLTSTAGLEGFTNVYKLLLQKNYLTNIDALAGMSRLHICLLNANALTTSCLANLEQHTGLTELMLQGNTAITSLESISKTKGTPGTALTYFNANDLTNLSFSSDYWTADNKKVVFTISTLLLPSKYALEYVNVSYLRPATSLTDTELKSLKNNTYITSLNLSSCRNLTQDAIAEVIPTLTNLKELNLSSTNLNSLTWVSNISNKTILRGINIQNTSVTDITPLVDFTNLGCLVINGSSIKLYDSSNVTLNTNVTKIINTIGNHSYGSWSNTCLGYGGFIPNSTYLQNQMPNLTGVTKWTFNALGSVNVDLRSWTGLTYLGGYCGSGQIYLPSTITNFGADANATYYLDNPLNNFAITLSFSRECPVITNNTKNYTLSVSSATKSPSYYSSLFTPYITSISITSGSSDSSIINASGVDYTGATNLKTLSLSSYLINNFDFSLLPNSLTTLNVTNCSVKRLTKTGNINISTVNLSSNNISSVEGFEGATITSLNLKNNNLSNYVTLTTESGTKTVTTAEILAGINGLQKVYLAGNTDLTDFTALINAGFKDDGSHNFTK
jgi:hypothetical protein